MDTYSASVKPVVALLWLGWLPMAWGAGECPRVAVRMVNGFPVVDQVSINGSGPYRFLLDTGAQSSAISPELARRLNLEATYAVMQVTVTAERPAPAHIVRQLTVAAAPAENVELVEAPLERVRQAVGHVDGVVGQNFLSRFAWLLDMERGELLFDLERTHEARLSERRTPAATAQGRLVVPVNAAGEVVPMVLDSGASHVILFFETKLARMRTVELKSGAGGAKAHAGNLRRLSVGGVEFEDLVAAVAQSRAAEEKGLLPANLFRAIYADAGSGFVVFNPEGRGVRSGACGRECAWRFSRFPRPFSWR